MGHKDKRVNHLDSAGMSSSTRQKARRGVLAAVLACLVSGIILTGCAEDRSNLIPKDTADSLIEQLDRAQALAESNQCFKAQDVALSAQLEIENLGPEVDPELKRALIDGVTQLQGFLGDPGKCLELENSEEPVETEEPPTEPEGATGETGTTGTGPTTTGDQGQNDDDQDSEPPQGNNGNGNGNGPPATPPGTNPEPPVTPPDPTTPPSTGPGSGGLGPG